MGQTINDIYKVQQLIHALDWNVDERRPDAAVDARV